MRKLIVALAMLLWTSMALGDIISVSWTPPTTRVDGSALLASEIKHYRLSWTVKGVAQPDKIVTGSSYSLDTGLLTGRVCVWMRTVDVDLLESDPTPQECKNVKPNPPSGVKAL